MVTAIGEGLSPSARYSSGVSYDLILWSSETSVRKPGELWKALYVGANPDRPSTLKSTLTYDDAKALVLPLHIERLVAAFRREFAADLEVEADPANGTAIRGAGWEFTLREGAYYAHVTCSWDTAKSDAAITRLRRAALRARCSTYDVQIDTLFEPSED